MCRISRCTKPRPTQPPYLFLVCPHHGQQAHPAWCAMVRDSERQKQEPKGSGGRWRCGRRGGAVPSGAEVAPPGHPGARRCWRPADRSPLADPARGGSGRRGGAASRSRHGRRRTKARWAELRRRLWRMPPDPAESARRGQTRGRAAGGRSCLDRSKRREAKAKASSRTATPG